VCIYHTVTRHLYLSCLQCFEIVNAVYLQTFLAVIAKL
jgi:hypothetical protein